jgi:hypothetical protein
VSSGLGDTIPLLVNSSQSKHITQFGVWGTVQVRSRLTFLLTHLLIFSLSSGCAVNGVGSVVANVTVAKGGRVVDLYSLGGHLRTWEAEPGFSVGYSRRSYIYSCGPQRQECIPAGWYYFNVPNLSRAVARNVENVGLDIFVARPLFGVTLGYQTMTVMVILPIEKKTTMRLRYISGKPEATIVDICEEGQICDQ